MYTFSKRAFYQGGKVLCSFWVATLKKKKINLSRTLVDPTFGKVWQKLHCKKCQGLTPRKPVSIKMSTGQITLVVLKGRVQPKIKKSYFLALTVEYCRDSMYL